MENKCIYCFENDASKFTKKEHVLMQSFGTFGSNTPTLDCVCDICNKFFGDGIDQTFSRNSLEGITRYRKGIYSSEKRKQDSGYLTITLPETEEFGEWGGMAVWIDGVTGTIMPPFPQVHFQNSEGKYIILLKIDLKSLDWKAEGYSDKNIKIFAPSRKEHDELMAELKLIGINYNLKHEFKNDFFEKSKDDNVMVTIKGTINKTIKRALAKILFNFSAKYLGEEQVLGQQWDKVRRYIRYNEGDVKSEVGSDGFWGSETQYFRYSDDAYNIRIENEDSNVVGRIQFFNLFLYKFTLAENHRVYKEVAVRFVPGVDPMFGKKYDKVDFYGYKIPIVR